MKNHKLLTNIDRLIHVFKPDGSSENKSREDVLSATSVPDLDPICRI
jgi:hypothetical protein